MIKINSAKQMTLHSCANLLENMTCSVLVWYSQHSLWILHDVTLPAEDKSIWTSLLYWALHIDVRNAQWLSFYCCWEPVYLVHIGIWTTHYRQTEKKNEGTHSSFTEQQKLMLSASSRLPYKKSETFPIGHRTDEPNFKNIWACLKFYSKLQSMWC